VPPKKGLRNPPRRGRTRVTDSGAPSDDQDSVDALLSILRSADVPKPPAPSIAREAGMSSVPDAPSSRRASPKARAIPATDQSPLREGGEDFSALVNILRATNPDLHPREPRGDNAAVNIRVPDDLSAVESAGLDDVARSLAAAESCTTVLMQSPWAGAQSVRDVMTAATTRAAAVLQLLRFLKGDYTPVTSTLPAAAIIQRVTQSAEPEWRLRGISLSSTLADDDLTIAADDSLLSHVLLGLLLTTFTLLEDVENPKVSIAVERRGAGRPAFSITQAHVPAPLTWTGDPVTTSRALHGDDALRLISLSAGHRFARSSGGRFTASAEESGTRFVVEIAAPGADAI
jgi:hypothetical protein